jgi:hypothetical protein
MSDIELKSITPVLVSQIEGEADESNMTGVTKTSKES